MKIASYNIWDSDAGMPERLYQVTDEIIKTGADIICLQEAAGHAAHERISELCGYTYSHWQEQNGLSILSRYPIKKTSDSDYRTYAVVEAENKALLIVNVHLPWKSIAAREKSIVDIVARTADIEADLTFLTGDFNSSEDSSVHRYLTNRQSLSGSDAYYFDLAEVFADMSEKSPQATLNFRKNPRWGVAQPINTIEVSQRVDWIMLKNPYPEDFPVLTDFKIFGTEISPKTGLSASGHYGVLAEIRICRSKSI